MAKNIPIKKDFSSGGVVWDPTKKAVLMVQVENLAHKVLWTFPKGHPEKNESEEDAAVREVREETGWSCQIKKPLMDVQYFYTRGKQKYHKTVRWYLMTQVEKVGDYDPKEILACKWYSFSEASALVTYDSDKKLLAKLEEHIKEASGK